MEAERDELIALAAENDWAARKTDNFEAYDWSVETWELELLWTLVGVKAHVTFPLDPQGSSKAASLGDPGNRGAARLGENPSDYFETSFIQCKNDKQDLVTFLDRNRTRIEPDKTTDHIPDASNYPR